MPKVNSKESSISMVATFLNYWLYRELLKNTPLFLDPEPQALHLLHQQQANCGKLFASHILFFLLFSFFGEHLTVSSIVYVVGH